MKGVKKVPKKIAKSYAISDAKISFVSLVDKAANKHQFLITKAEGNQANIHEMSFLVQENRFKMAVSCMGSTLPIGRNGSSGSRYSPICLQYHDTSRQPCL